jgi:isopropylmalate/homocitrate/citramalate synthase
MFFHCAFIFHKNFRRTGNVPTEDVVFMLNSMGFHTGVDMDKLLEASKFICEYLGITSRSNAGTAIVKKREAAAAASACA